MKTEDYIMIKELIEEENDTFDLKAIKYYIEERIKKIEKNNTTKFNKEMLLKSVEAFLKEELDYKEKAKLKIKNIEIEVKNKKKLSSIYDVCIFDLLGVELTNRGAGPHTISTIEKLLNKYDLSLNQELSKDQISELEEERVKKNIKKKK